MSTAGISEAGHGGDTLRLATAGILCSWALQEYSAMGHCWDSMDILHVGHCKEIRQLNTLHCAEGEESMDFSKSNNPTVRVGNKPCSSHWRLTGNWV